MLLFFSPEMKHDCGRSGVVEIASTPGCWWCLVPAVLNSLSCPSSPLVYSSSLVLRPDGCLGNFNGHAWWRGSYPVCLFLEFPALGKRGHVMPAVMSCGKRGQ